MMQEALRLKLMSSACLSRRGRTMASRMHQFISIALVDIATAGRFGRDCTHVRRLAMATQVDNGIDRVGPTRIYPASDAFAPNDAEVRGPGHLAQAEERAASRTARPWANRSLALGFGRAIFGGYFLYSGINHFLNRKMLTEYARSKSTPAPDWAVMGSGALIALGGLSLVTGVRPQAGASLITAFLLGVSPQIHDFWTIEDQQQRMGEFVNFMKNMALIGGACFAAAVPEPWPASIPLGRTRSAA
jgi:putative oxidoreductase